MCPDCEARRKLVRDAWTNKRLGKAASHLVKGAAEVAGLKKKTGTKEVLTKKSAGAITETAKQLD